MYLSRYFDNVIGYACNKQCFWRKRLNGPAYVICPLFYSEQAPDARSGSEASPFLREDVSGLEIEKRAHLIAFGALERVIVTSVAPHPAELVAIERPDYIDS